MQVSGLELGGLLGSLSSGAVSDYLLRTNAGAKGNVGMRVKVLCQAFPYPLLKMRGREDENGLEMGTEEGREGPGGWCRDRDGDGDEEGEQADGERSGKREVVREGRGKSAVSKSPNED